MPTLVVTTCAAPIMAPVFVPLVRKHFDRIHHRDRLQNCHMCMGDMTYLMPLGSKRASEILNLSTPKSS